MSVTPSAAAAPASKRTRRRWSLQTRLMLTVIGIVALTLVGSAIAISSTIGGVLTGTVDTRLETYTRQIQLFAPGFGGATSRDAYEVLSSGRQETGYLLIIEPRDGDVSGAVVTSQDEVTELTDEQISATQNDADPRGFSTVTVPGLGAYRVVPFSAGGTTGLAGLPMSDVNSTVTEILTTILLVTLAGLVLLAVAIAIVIRRSLKPLRAVAETATRVAALPMSEGSVSIAERVPAAEADERTEIGQVGAALNTLLDHVDQSLTARQHNEERMRAFVADASHELRTPLASIRGYSELSLRALSHASEEVARETTQQSLERIQAQSLRMTSLVEDLLLLARLDEGQELVYGSVDLTSLAVEAVADARAAGPDHNWLLEVGEQPVIVAGDNTRLHQVAANLLANARIHTPEGTTVTSSVVLEASTAILRIHDDGPGIDPAITKDLFERFSRADRSRARQTGGTGLGLSIARAIAAAHHGELTVTSEPGSTTFELRLPARPSDPVAAE